jgi:hypothetical protein
MSHGQTNRQAGALVGALMALALLAGNAVGQDDRLFVPGTGVSMVPPQGYELGEDFAGFIEVSTAATFVVTPLPPDMAMEVTTAFESVDLARELLAANTAIVATDRDEIAGVTGSVAIISGTQTTEDRTDRKWIAVFSDEQSVMVTVTLPPGAELNEPSVFGALASLDIEEPPALEHQIAALPFVVSPIAPFRFESTIGASAVKLSASDASIVVASMARQRRGDELKALAEELFRGYGPAQLRVLRSAEVDFVGGRGWLIEATGLDGDAGTEIRVMQWLSLGENRHMLLAALAPENEIDTLWPAIEQVVASVERKTLASGERP